MQQKVDRITALKTELLDEAKDVKKRADDLHAKLAANSTEENQDGTLHSKSSNSQILRIDFNWSSL